QYGVPIDGYDLAGELAEFDQHHDPCNRLLGAHVLGLGLATDISTYRALDGDSIAPGNCNLSWHDYFRFDHAGGQHGVHSAGVHSHLVAKAKSRAGQGRGVRHTVGSRAVATGGLESSTKARAPG